MTTLSPGTVFLSSGFNHHSTPTPPNATPADIDRKLKRAPFNGRDWPRDSPVAMVYDVCNSSTKMVLLNKRRQKQSRLRGHSSHNGDIIAPQPERHTDRPKVNTDFHTKCCDTSSVTFKPQINLDLRWANLTRPTSSDIANFVHRHRPCYLTDESEEINWCTKPRPHTSPTRTKSDSDFLLKVMNDPNLSLGEQRYLYSISRIYSVNQMRQLKQSQYDQLLFKEFVKGYHTLEEYDRYYHYLHSPRNTQFGRTGNSDGPQRAKSAPVSRSRTQNTDGSSKHEHSQTTSTLFSSGLFKRTRLRYPYIPGTVTAKHQSLNPRSKSASKRKKSAASVKEHRPTDKEQQSDKDSTADSSDKEKTTKGAAEVKHKEKHKQKHGSSDKKDQSDLVLRGSKHKNRATSKHHHASDEEKSLEEKWEDDDKHSSNSPANQNENFLALIMKNVENEDKENKTSKEMGRERSDSSDDHSETQKEGRRKRSDSGSERETPQNYHQDVAAESRNEKSDSVKDTLRDTSRNERSGSETDTFKESENEIAKERKKETSSSMTEIGVKQEVKQERSIEMSENKEDRENEIVLEAKEDTSDEMRERKEEIDTTEETRTQTSDNKKESEKEMNKNEVMIDIELARSSSMRESGEKGKTESASEQEQESSSDNSESESERGEISDTTGSEQVPSLSVHAHKEGQTRPFSRAGMKDTDRERRLSQNYNYDIDKERKTADKQEVNKTTETKESLDKTGSEHFELHSRSEITTQAEIYPRSDERHIDNHHPGSPGDKMLDNGQNHLTTLSVPVMSHASSESLHGNKNGAESTERHVSQDVPDLSAEERNHDVEKIEY